MSTSKSSEKLVVYDSQNNWKGSVESIVTQKVLKLSQSECLIKFCEYNPGLQNSRPRLKEIDDLKEKKTSKWEVVRHASTYLRMRTGSTLKKELEILRVNMSVQENNVDLKYSMEKNKRKKNWKLRKFMKKMKREKLKDLCTEIESSEAAKTDKEIWKFLTRGPSFKKDIIYSRKVILKLQTLHLPGVEFLPESRFQNTQPVKVTCPNCRFFITTNVKKVSTIRTKLSSAMLSVIGLCIVPHFFYAFKDTVHLCPLCKIYLGFCPAFNTRVRKMSTEKSEKRRDSALKNHMKMVSASSTSAKNLFVESKLRLSDRVQVNVNNIAAITRQIQRGSKSSENLTACAKNLALQEAAIENSETSLKKLKLLTSQISSQLDSLHNNSSKMEVVLEQVCSMQR